MPRKKIKYSPYHFPLGMLANKMCPYCKVLLEDKESPFHCQILEEAKGGECCSDYSFDHCPLTQGRHWETSRIL